MNCKFYHTISYKSKSDCKYMHSIEYKCASKPSLMSGKKMQTETLTLNLGITTSLVFTIPRANLGSLKNIPYFSYPAEWNTLWDLRFRNNRITFQINLKNNLLGELSPPDPMLPPFLPHPITQLPLLYHPLPSLPSFLTVPW